MESARDKIINLANAERNQTMLHWLQTVCGIDAPLQPLMGDASTRRYFRIQHQGLSMIVMDAPPPQENCQSYVAIATGLRQLGLATPQIFQADLQQGFLLITDFGDATYLNTLNVFNVDELYHRALDKLVIMQACQQIETHTLLPFTAEWMQKEWVWHKEWFLHKLLGVSFEAVEKQLDECYAQLVTNAVSQPQVFMHRDYHSANLMVLEKDVGILDFQDAFRGPLTYDLVSLLRDCYMNWPTSKVYEWALSYFKRLNLSMDEATFLRGFDYMGMQRHLKALMTFARKKVRDQQPRYLQYVPRTLDYLSYVSGSYIELSSLHDFINEVVQPAFAKVMLCGVE
jgi:aminoglycoside/choline kinase family phosphotransferase